MEQQRGSSAAEAARSAESATCEWPGCQRTATERLAERLDRELGDDWSGADSPRFCEHHAELVARDAVRCMSVQRAFFRSDRF